MRIMKRSHQRWGLRCVLALLTGWCALAQAAYGADRINLRLGLWQSQIAIADLEDFSETGTLSPALQPYRSVLTPKVQQLLDYRFPIDTQLGDRILRNIFHSPLSLQIYQSIVPMLPDSRLDYLEQAVTTTLKNNHFSVLSILKAYPGKEITLNLSAALSFALQFNHDYWQSRLLEPLLVRDLLVNSPEDLVGEIDPSQPADGPVEKTSLILRDSQRNRIIPVDLYTVPGSLDSAPLVVISHGFGSDRNYLSGLAYHLASHGLTVAAIEHPGSSLRWLMKGSKFSHLATLVPPEEFIDRPQDIRFMLDYLETVNHQPGPFYSKLNTNKVTMVGHSLGGYTAFVLAGAELDLASLRHFCRDRLPLGRSPADWLQCAAADLTTVPQSLKDDRIAQVIAISPVIGRLFGETGISKVKIPTLILANTNDAVTPALEHQIRPFNHLTGPKYLLTAIGTPHLSIGNLRYSNSVASPFQPLQHLLNGVSLAFIKQLTPEKENYQVFLSPTYAQSFSTPQIPLRLNQSLPGSLWERIEVSRLLHWLGWS
ncbi:alpha/beta hydrolase [Roseofilum sp. BLCC_M154]|uniref:Alpha/beta hydrolase n=1 Tax=Roseofilum acuticapitatum BLCC-M154 TaxID=3022444 RepID=A0ABT7AR82_9CYAN|nr:alpha/beta hydrolase [Roseofilum acuticapitatum]MDJ1169407.1 alpha/beta hydrolase [Roseofilum acuticapitatum BLCC-M154]